MLRISLFFLLLMAFFTADIQAASAARPIHRHRPMSGDFRPVYRRYRGAGRHKDRFSRFLRHRSTRHGWLKKQGSSRRGTF